MEDRELYRDDCRVVLRGLEPQSVDLIYLDPPFNSNEIYNLPYEKPSGTSRARKRERERERVAVEAFNDMWTWTDDDNKTLEIIKTQNSDLWHIIASADRIFGRQGKQNMVSYLVNMAIRLMPMPRLLKPTGSLYLHCDPTASHYLKMMLDAIMGPDNFRNEITWRRIRGQRTNKFQLGRNSDRILFYSATPEQNHFVTPRLSEHNEDYIEQWYTKSDSVGRYRTRPLVARGGTQGDSGQPWRGRPPAGHWIVPEILTGRYEKETGQTLTGTVRERLDILADAGLILFNTKGNPYWKKYLSETALPEANDMWVDDDVRPMMLNDKENTGYPTQKPLSLLERIVMASTREGDVVLDPFCGCGTTLYAAEKLRRRWIGIDISAYATAVVTQRLLDGFRGRLARSDIRFHSLPRNAIEAWEMAHTLGPNGNYEGAYELEKWICAELKVNYKSLGRRPGDKGADFGVDGILEFHPVQPGKMWTIEKAIIQVKAGKVKPDAVKALNYDVLSRDDVSSGVFICFDAYRRTADKHIDRTTWTDAAREYPRVQVFTIEDYFAGKEIDLPNLPSHKFVG